MPEHMQHELLAGSPTSLQVYAIRLPDGSCPVADWLDGLSNPHAAAILQRVSMFSQRGWLRSPDSFNQLESADPGKGLPRVDEIKHSGKNLRLYVVGYRHGDSVAYVTHGSYKPSKKRVSQEVERARRIFMKGMQS